MGLRLGLTWPFVFYCDSRFRSGRGVIRHAASSWNLVQVFILIFQLHEVGDVKERVALQANIDECRLHSGENAGDASFIDGSGKRVFIFTLEIHLG